MIELHAPVALCGPDGRLNPAAVGWSRRPLHRCRVDRPWGRRKRWHHWCVTSKRLVIAMTLADLDYLGLAGTLVLDLESGRTVERLVLRRPGALPDAADAGTAAVAGALSFEDGRDRVRLRASGPRVVADVTVVRPPGHESLTVVVPFGGGRFQLTSKQNALPATGTVAIDGTSHALEDAFACLDFGRGVWPARAVWNWASASSASVGLNLGARWTDDENAVCLDGRLHKLGPVRFAYDLRAPRRPWRITGDGVDLTFVPLHSKVVRARPLLATHVSFGRFSGAVAGERVDELLGWAEDFAALW